jgi:tetratricopeptide (TPR) repeat protein
LALNIQHKKDDGQDPVMGGVAGAKKFIEKNSNMVLWVCAAVLVIAGGYFLYNAMKESAIKKAQEVFGVGILDYNAEQYDRALASFNEVADRFKHTPLATMSAFMMGSIYLQQSNSEQALTWFEAAANGVPSGFVRAQAMEGMAAAYEEKGDAESAIKYLKRALRDNTAAHRHAAIRWKLALLSKDDASAAGEYCKELLADTLAAAYHQKAENLLAVINNKNQ